MSKNATIILILALGLISGNSQIFIDYGVQNEGKQLQKLFNDVTNGYYVDYGAYDPIFASNTLNLYVKGWDGVNVEANPERSNRFNIERPDQINLNFAVGQQDTFVTLYELDEDSSSTISSKVKDFLKGVKSVKKQIKIPSFTLQQICHRYYKRKPLFMNIDIEGYGAKALQSNDWTNDKCIPEVIISQLNEQTKQSGFPLPEIVLTKHGYKKVKTQGLNQFYIHKDAYDKYAKKIAQNTPKLEALKDISLYNIVFMLGNHLKVSSQVATHYEPLRDGIFYKFARRNEPIQLEKINRQSNVLTPQNLNRPIVVFHFDPKSNIVILGNSTFIMKEIQISSHKFWQINVTASNNMNFRALIFNHDLYPNPQLKVLTLAQAAHQMELNKVYQPAKAPQPTLPIPPQNTNVSNENLVKTKQIMDEFTLQIRKNEQKLKQMRESFNSDIKSMEQTFKNNKNAQISLLAAIERKLNDLQTKIGVSKKPKTIKPSGTFDDSFQANKTLESQLANLQFLELSSLVTAVVMGFFLCVSICIKKQKEYNEKLKRLGILQKVHIEDTQAEIQ